MIDFSKPVQTKKGIPVTIISTEARGNCPIIGYIGQDDNILRGWMTNGTYGLGYSNSCHNLENVPEYWVKEKEAFKTGKTIQFKSKQFPEWQDVEAPLWFPLEDDSKFEYRVKPELVPLTKDDIKVGDTFFNPTSMCEYQWAAKSVGAVMLGNVWRSYEELKRGWQIKSPDSDWRPCEKEE